MKSIFLSTAILAFIFPGCSGDITKEKENIENAHTHKDGSTHQHTEDTVKQEEFTVFGDSSGQQAEPQHEHSPDDHKHPHKH